MQTMFKLCTQTDPLTPSKHNFLRVSAQMHNLDKQKTTPAWKTLAPILGRHSNNIKTNK